MKGYVLEKMTDCTKIPVILTRPQEEAYKTALMLETCGFSPYVYPMLNVQVMMCNPSFLAPFRTIITTSLQALKALSSLPSCEFSQKKLYVVGCGSQACAQTLGFHTVISANGDVKDLIQRIQRDRGLDRLEEPCIYLRGDSVSFPLREYFGGKGLVLQEKKVYKATQAKFLDPRIFDLLRSSLQVVVLFYSSRSAEAFKNLFPVASRDLLKGHIACVLSTQIKGLLRDLPFQSVYVSGQPNEASLIDLLKGITSARIT